jgi:hypothetical protein
MILRPCVITYPSLQGAAFLFLSHVFSGYVA